MKNKFIKSYGMPIILLLSILVGTILGIALKDTYYLKPFGDIFLNLMYTIVVPLVFFTISSSIANMLDLKRLGKILKYVFIVFIITSLISSVFMILGIFLLTALTSAQFLISPLLRISPMQSFIHATAQMNMSRTLQSSRFESISSIR